MFFNKFLKKIQHKILHLKTQWIFFHSLGVALKYESKVKKKWSESVKNDTKAGIT